ncbi:hypothetical protein M9458_037902, partial [Cirrhinus mrigala]
YFDAHALAMDYRGLGFRECLAETARYLSIIEGLDNTDPLRIRLVSHLNSYASQREAHSGLGHLAWGSAFGTPPGHLAHHLLLQQQQGAPLPRSTSSPPSSNSSSPSSSAARPQQADWHGDYRGRADRTAAGAAQHLPAPWAHTTYYIQAFSTPPYITFEPVGISLPAECISSAVPELAGPRDSLQQPGEALQALEHGNRGLLNFCGQT